jgi:uncharacterized protein (DUF433 family)
VVTVLAFSIDQAARLTGLSSSTLRRFDRSGFFVPSLAYEVRRAPDSRVYDFRDVVGLKVVSILRTRHGVSLQELRKVKPWLLEQSEAPWASLRLYVAGRKIYFRAPDDTLHAGRPAGQTAMPIEMSPVVSEIENGIRRMQTRASGQIGRIERHRRVVGNAWVLEGTRIPTRAVWNLHQAGLTDTEIIAEYPTLIEQDVQAAISHEEAVRSRKAG